MMTIPVLMMTIDEGLYVGVPHTQIEVAEDINRRRSRPIACVKHLHSKSVPMMKYRFTLG